MANLPIYISPDHLMTHYHHKFVASLVSAFAIGAMLISGTSLTAADTIASEFSNSPAIGSKLDGFSLTDYQGKEWKLNEFQSKKAIVFAFVGTQCPLAKLYSSKLVELERQYRDRGIAFVAVDANVQDSLAEMAAHARKFGFEFAFLKDPAQELANRLGVTRTPEVCVIDSTSMIRYRGRIDDQYGIGYSKDAVSKKELVVALEAILKNEDVATTTTAASLVRCRHTA